jgi:hypothetical protein
MIMTSSILVPLLRGASSRSWATCSARVMVVEVPPRASNSPINQHNSGGLNPLGLLGRLTSRRQPARRTVTPPLDPLPGYARSPAPVIWSMSTPTC